MIDQSHTDLIGLIQTRLRKVARTWGGEYAGACPFCGGRDRFRVWPHSDHPNWWCRVCHRGGDAIAYIRLMDGASFHEACQRLGLNPGAYRQSRRLRPPAPGMPPEQRWQDGMAWWVRHWKETLWSEAGVRALDYLRQRGLRDETISRAGLGFCNTSTRVALDEHGAECIYAWRGITLPVVGAGALWSVRVRTATQGWVANEHSQDALWGADRVQHGCTVWVSESPFDALLIDQVAGDLVVPVATCGTTGGRSMRWARVLARAAQVVLSFDADAAGEQAANYWSNVFHGAIVHRPLLKDAGAMVKAGLDIRRWVEAALPPAPGGADEDESETDLMARVITLYARGQLSTGGCNGQAVLVDDERDEVVASFADAVALDAWVRPLLGEDVSAQDTDSNSWQGAAQ